MAPRTSHRASSRTTRGPADRPVYLVVVVLVAAGLLLAWAGEGHAVRGAGLIGGAMLLAALARLVLPERYTGLLSSRRKSLDVLMFSVFGVALLALAVMLS